jgi:predicted nucleic acid-binding protein
LFLLDTNVLSEFVRPAPDAGVQVWLNAQSAAELFTSAITRAEMEWGAALLPEGRRKATLAAAIKVLFTEQFEGRVLPFDTDAAAVTGELAAGRAAQGKPISREDAMVASIALARSMTVVTRNVRDFKGIEGLTLLNPWKV